MSGNKCYVCLARGTRDNWVVECITHGFFTQAIIDAYAFNMGCVPFPEYLGTDVRATALRNEHIVQQSCHTLGGGRRYFHPACLYGAPGDLRRRNLFTRVRSPGGQQLRLSANATLRLCGPCNEKALNPGSGDVTQQIIKLALHDLDGARRAEPAAAPCAEPAAAPCAEPASAPRAEPASAPCAEESASGAEVNAAAADPVGAFIDEVIANLVGAPGAGQVAAPICVAVPATPRVVEFANAHGWSSAQQI